MTQKATTNRKRTGPLELLSERKIKTARKLLKDSLSIILFGEGFLGIAMRSEAAIVIEAVPEPDRAVLIYGISASLKDAKDFEKDCSGKLCHFLRDKLSIRDLNFDLVIDEISDYLSENLYDLDTEKPLAMEFVVLEVSASEPVAIALISLAGELESFVSTELLEPFKIVGELSTSEKTELHVALKEICSQKVAENAEDVAGAYKELTDSVGSKLKILLEKKSGDCFIAVLPASSLLFGLLKKRLAEEKSDLVSVDPKNDSK